MRFRGVAVEKFHAAKPLSLRQSEAGNLVAKAPDGGPGYLLVVGVCRHDLLDVLVAHVLVVLVAVLTDLAPQVVIVAGAEVNVVVSFVLAVESAAHRSSSCSVPRFHGDRDSFRLAGVLHQG